jgi:hypothetical protein
MRSQKRIDFVSFPIERQGVRTRFRRHDFLTAHRGDIDDIDYARIADGNIKVPRSRVEKNDVRGAAEAHITKDAARCGVDREQAACIAGAQQTARGWIKI